MVAVTTCQQVPFICACPAENARRRQDLDSGSLCSLVARARQRELNGLKSMATLLQPTQLSFQLPVSQRARITKKEFSLASPALFTHSLLLVHLSAGLVERWQRGPFRRSRPPARGA